MKISGFSSVSTKSLLIRNPFSASVLSLRISSKRWFHFQDKTQKMSYPLWHLNASDFEGSFSARTRSLDPPSLLRHSTNQGCIQVYLVVACIYYFRFIVCIYFICIWIYLIDCFLFRCLEYLLTAILNEVNNKMPKNLLSIKRWIMRGFSGHFPPFQLLYLWDLVLAYDSMEVTFSLLFFRHFFSPAVSFARCCHSEFSQGEPFEGEWKNSKTFLDAQFFNMWWYINNSVKVHIQRHPRVRQN